MKKYLVVVALLLLCALGVVSASNTIGDVKTEKEVYSFEIGPGGYWDVFSTLSDVAPYDFDVYVMTVTNPCQVEVIVEDCCIMGDTIAMKAGRMFWKATSPDTIDVKTPRVLSVGTYKFFVGYLDVPGGLPAGYYVYVYGY